VASDCSRQASRKHISDWQREKKRRRRKEEEEKEKEKKRRPLTHMGQSLQLCANKASYGLVLCRSLEGPMPHLRSTIVCPQTKSQNSAVEEAKASAPRWNVTKKTTQIYQSVYEYILKSILSSALHLNSRFSRILTIYPKVHDYYFICHITSDLLSC
jgi:hypothetical protein